MHASGLQRWWEANFEVQCPTPNVSKWALNSNQAFQMNLSFLICGSALGICSRTPDSAHGSNCLGFFEEYVWSSFHEWWGCFGEEVEIGGFYVWLASNFGFIILWIESLISLVLRVGSPKSHLIPHCHNLWVLGSFGITNPCSLLAMLRVFVFETTCIWHHIPHIA